ncbi:MAG: hypothetical protein C6Y20_11695 [Tagaea sp. CACIAM 22H2]|jgi:hypothetical protein|nr:hypothetical protein [Tagaea sp. CACIAM 22H2]
MSDLSTLRALSPEAFAALGHQGIAYVRRTEETGEQGPASIYAIHSAAGERIGAAPSRDLAFAAIRQHGLEPLDAH